MNSMLFPMLPAPGMVKQFDWPKLMLPIKTMRKAKLRPMGLCYQKGVNQRSGVSLYPSAPGLSKFEQFNWPELMLPIKLFRVKICELAVTNDM